MGKLKRGGFIFKMWVGDHLPRHVHIFKDGKFLVKWDLDRQRVMEGRITRQIFRALKDLQKEGKL